jgi:hypothetical protein
MNGAKTLYSAPPVEAVSGTERTFGGAGWSGAIDADLTLRNR